MPDLPGPDEQILWELQAAHDGMVDDVARNQRVHEAVAAALGRIAREHYPALATGMRTNCGSWPTESPGGSLRPGLSLPAATNLGCAPIA